jgi:hypothetical protein
MYCKLAYAVGVSVYNAGGGRAMAQITPAM